MIENVKDYRKQMNEVTSKSDKELYEDGMTKIEKALSDNLDAKYPNWYVMVQLDKDTLFGSALNDIRLHLESLGYIVITRRHIQFFPGDYSAQTHVELYVVFPSESESERERKATIDFFLPYKKHDKKEMLTLCASGNSQSVLDRIRESLKEED